MSWTPGNNSHSQTLTVDDDLFETHINELRVAIDNRIPVTVATANGDYTNPHAAIAAGATYIKVKKATYTFTTKLSIPDDVLVECEPGTIFVQADGANIANSLVDIGSRASLSWVTISGNKANNLTWGRGVTIAAGSNSLIEHVVVL